MELTNLIPNARERPTPDSEAVEAIDARIADILRPPGALARLDGVASWLAGWQATPTPLVTKPHALIFAADHGVAAEGVSAFPAEVTSAMLAAFNASRASVSAIAAVVGAEVTAIDVGVGKPTGNIRNEAALDEARFAKAFEQGRQAVREIDTDLLVLGEMGIGNTTPAAAVTAGILCEKADEIEHFVGRGTGVDDARFANKVEVVADAVARLDPKAHPLEVLRQVGGSELVAIAGALVEARMTSTPVLLDGYIATSPALVLGAIDPDLVANCRAGHCSAEPGHTRGLEHLGLSPLLSLDMALGEASGAMAAIPLLKIACALVNDVATFTEWFGE